MSTNRSGMQLWMRKCRAQYSYDATIRDATASCLHNSPNRKTDTSNSAKKERICKMTLSNAIQIVKQYFDANAMTLDETEAFITLIQTVEGEHANECNLLPQWYMQVFPLPWRYWPREVQLHVLLLSALRTLRRLRRKIHLHAKRDQRLFGMWYTAPQGKLRPDYWKNASHSRIDAKNLILKNLHCIIMKTQKKNAAANLLRFRGEITTCHIGASAQNIGYECIGGGNPNVLFLSMALHVFDRLSFSVFSWSNHFIAQIENKFKMNRK